MTNETFYIMKWNKNEGTYGQPKNAGMYVAIDRPSGGYPWATDSFLGAEKFPDTRDSRARIDNIRKMFPYFDLFQVTIELTPID